jgi:hypothetical protein
MRIAAVLILLFTLTAAPASACYATTAQFKPWMNEFSKLRQGVTTLEIDGVASFQGYVQGVFDTYATVRLVCASGITIDDVGDVVVRRFDDWMKANSALPSKTCASDVIREILLKRFPCDPPPEAKPPAK